MRKALAYLWGTLLVLALWWLLAAALGSPALPTPLATLPVLAEEAVKEAVKDYYDKNGIEYDKEKFAQTHDCEHCGE